MHRIKQFDHLKIKLDDIKSATNNFGGANYVGKGGFGKVYKGELDHSKGRTMVAVKRLDRTFGQGEPEFWKEIMLLSQYRHENIVSLLGFCDESGEKILVYQYASKKSLDLYLNSNDLTWLQRLKICIGAARGLAYLHSSLGTKQRILHRDVKSSNILLDENWNASISDFGLSKFGPANQTITFQVSRVVGTIGYCDPLYIESGLLTKESDVYSFGVVLFEVLCGRLCIGTDNNLRKPLIEIVRKSYQGSRINEIVYFKLKDQINSDSLKEFTEIAYRCLKRHREERPLMTEIVRKLEIAHEYQAPRQVMITKPPSPPPPPPPLPPPPPPHFKRSNVPPPRSQSRAGSSVSPDKPSMKPPPPPPPPPPHFKRSNVPPPRSQSRAGSSVSPDKPSMKPLPPPPPPPPHFKRSNVPPPRSQSRAGSSVSPDKPSMKPLPPPPPPHFKRSNVPPPRSQSRAGSSVSPDNPSMKPLPWVKNSLAMGGNFLASSHKHEKQSWAPEIDTTELRDLFSVASVSNHKKGAGKVKRKKVQLVDIRRAINCEIMLTKIKIPLSDITNAILELDSSAFDINQVYELIKFCPTKEEMELLQGYTEDKEMLGNCEQFFLELMKIPRIEPKLRVFAFTSTFTSEVNDLRKHLITIDAATTEIKESTKLRKIMQTILTLGNTINSGTTRGSATRFTLHTLRRLANTRANNKTTLLHYLCKLVAEKMPELLDFDKDLLHLEAASKIQFKTMDEEMMTITQGLEKVVQELDASANDGDISTRFQKELKSFHDNAEDQVSDLLSMYHANIQNAHSLVRYFGEDPADRLLEEVTYSLVTFVVDFKKAHDENEKRAHAEMKKMGKKTIEEDVDLTKHLMEGAGSLH